MMANTIFTPKYSTCLTVGTFSRLCQASKVSHLRFNSKTKQNRFSVSEQNLGLRIFQNNGHSSNKMNMLVCANITPGGPLPADPFPGSWKVWILGTIFTMLLSFSRGKWGPLLQLKEKVETTIDEAERIVDIVEDVAEGVDKVAEEAVKHLPEGKFRDAVEFVEKVAEDIDKHAENAEDALEQVENMGNELESFFESTTHQENTVTVTDTTTEAKDHK